MARTYIISEICGDWALQIREPGHPHQFLYFNSENNADLVKSILEWEDAHPNEAVPYNPTLTPPNEWVSVEERLPEEKQRVIVRCERVGTSVGWILWGNWMTDIGPGTGKVTHWMPLPAPPGKDNNVPAKTPNEPLTQEDIDKMHFDRVWIDYGLDDSGERCGEDGVILYGKLYSIDTLDGSAFEDLLLNSCDGETLGRPGGDYTVYRRPPEGKEDT